MHVKYTHSNDCSVWDSLKVVDPVYTDTTNLCPAVPQEILVNLFPAVLFVAANLMKEKVGNPEAAALGTLVYIFPDTCKFLVTVHIEGIILVTQKH